MRANYAETHPATQGAAVPVIETDSVSMIGPNEPDFFHMNALSSTVAMKVNCDLQLTLMASSLYRLLGAEIGNGYEVAKSRHLFRDFIDASAEVTIDKRNIQVRFQSRAHNPLLIAAGFDKANATIAWLGGKWLQLVFGQPPV